MAKLTNVITLTAAWQALAVDKATVMFSVKGNGFVEYAVADAVGDLVSGDVGHVLPTLYRGGGDMVQLTGLGTKDVCARTNADGVTAGIKLAVTAF